VPEKAGFSGKTIARLVAACATLDGYQLALPDIKLCLFDNFPLVVIVLTQAALSGGRSAAEGNDIAHEVPLCCLG
jgi:hypothetical protein